MQEKLKDYGIAPAVYHGIQRIAIVIKIWWNIVGVVSVFTVGAKPSITKYLQTREPYGSAIIVLLSKYVPTCPPPPPPPPPDFHFWLCGTKK